MNTNKRISIQEAAKELNVSTKTLRRWEESGKLVPQRTEGNHRRYSASQIQDHKHSDQKINRIPSGSELDLTAGIITASVLDSIDNPIPQPEPQSELPIVNSKRNVLLASGIAGLITLILLAIVVSASGFMVKKDGQLAFVKLSRQDVLGISDANYSTRFKVNVPSTFSQNVEFLKGIDVTGVSTTSGGIITNNSDVNAGQGSVFASNILYSLVPGRGITVGPGQTPTITNTGVLSLGGQTGAVSLAAGSGISITGNTITNTNVYTAGSGINISDGAISSTVTGSTEDTFRRVLIGSDTIVATGTNDELEFIAGSNITLNADTTGKSITINSTGGGGTGTIDGSGTASRIPRFSDSDTLANSSINDLYVGGVALTIDPSGRLGWALQCPLHS